MSSQFPRSLTGNMVSAQSHSNEQREACNEALALQQCSICSCLLLPMLLLAWEVWTYWHERAPVHHLMLGIRSGDRRDQE